MDYEIINIISFLDNYWIYIDSTIMLASYSISSGRDTTFRGGGGKKFKQSHNNWPLEQAVEFHTANSRTLILDIGIAAESLGVKAQ